MLLTFKCLVEIGDIGKTAHACHFLRRIALIEEMIGGIHTHLGEITADGEACSFFELAGKIAAVEAALLGKGLHGQIVHIVLFDVADDGAEHL